MAAILEKFRRRKIISGFAICDEVRQSPAFSKQGEKEEAAGEESGRWIPWIGIPRMDVLHSRILLYARGQSEGISAGICSMEIRQFFEEYGMLLRGKRVVFDFDLERVYRFNLWQIFSENPKDVLAKKIEEFEKSKSGEEECFQVTKAELGKIEKMRREKKIVAEEYDAGSLYWFERTYAMTEEFVRKYIFETAPDFGCCKN